jgi:ADP-ribosylglycohydrolase
MSFREGRSGLLAYLADADALPLRDYVPLRPGTPIEDRAAACCRDQFDRALPDDDINYTVLALGLLETHGAALSTADVARAWLRFLPAGTTWTAERAAYSALLAMMDDEFVNGAEAGFDLAKCSENACNDWIGARIRADLYGWVCPGDPDLAVELALRDARLSHRGEGVYAAMFIAALGACIPATADLEEAVGIALRHVPATSQTADAVCLALDLSDEDDAVDRLHAEFGDLPPVHTLNNLAVVVWALCSARGDFSAAIGNAVTAGWDTDCNGATVGGLFGLTGHVIPEHWTRPWHGRIGVELAGIGELSIDELVGRTMVVARNLKGSRLH